MTGDMNSWTLQVSLLAIEGDENLVVSRDFPTVQEALEGAARLLGPHSGVFSEAHFCLRWAGNTCTTMWNEEEDD